MKTRVIFSAQKNAVAIAAKALKEGKVIVYPTETSYGLGCDAQNVRAVKKVHAVKKEPKSKPLIVLVPDIRTAEKIAVLSKTGFALWEKFMPGPLTLVAEKRAGKLNAIAGKTIALRVSSNPFARALAKKFGGPVVSTSANLHGQKPVFSAKKVVNIFSGKVDLIIDAGTLPKRKASTIFDCTRGKILRKGKITLKQIEKFF